MQANEHLVDTVAVCQQRFDWHRSTISHYETEKMQSSNRKMCLQSATISLRQMERNCERCMESRSSNSLACVCVCHFAQLVSHAMNAFLRNASTDLAECCPRKSIILGKLLYKMQNKIHSHLLYHPTAQRPCSKTRCSCDGTTAHIVRVWVERAAKRKCTLDKHVTFHIVPRHR